MSTERAHAYGRIMRTIRASRGPGCVDDAVGRLREACVTLVFADPASSAVDDLLRCDPPILADDRSGSGRAGP